MASSIASPGSSLPADRFYRAALFFLVLSGVLALSATGKLDALSSVAAPLAILYKGVRWWRGHPAELKQSTATRFVLAYILFIPLDLLFYSRSLAEGTGNPTVYAALLAAVHFLLLVTILRLYSAVTDRDAVFMAMLAFAALLAAAVFTIDTYFLAFFLAFLLFGVATFVGLEIRRGAAGAVFPPLRARSEAERRFHRALALAVLSVAIGGVAFGSLLFFFFPRFSAGYLARNGFQPSLMSGFTDNVELGQIGEIKQSTSVVMRVRTGAPVKYPMLRWRGIALSNFDGKRWTNDESNRQIQSPMQDGWINPLQPQRFRGAARPRHSSSPSCCSPSPVTRCLRPLRWSSCAAIFSPEPTPTTLPFAAAALAWIPRVPSSMLRIISRRSAMKASPFSRKRGQCRARTAGTVYPQEILRHVPAASSRARSPHSGAWPARSPHPAGNPFDKAVAMESYLRDNFAYTLNLTGKPGDDPLAHFLFETRAGTASISLPRWPSCCAHWAFPPAK